jgi:curved DNA-binding protein CbpA
MTMEPMSPVDPYRLLQVHAEADAEIIQVAYRKLAQRHHPDVAPSPDAARQMAELNAARDLLLDPERRAAYDRERAARDAAAAGRAAVPSAAAGRDGGGRRTPSWPGADAPPRSQPGSVLPFGRYAGWPLAEIARQNLEYIEWLDRMPIGRPYRADLDAILRQAGRRGASAAPERTRGLFRRR